ncbi:MAG: glycosyltransferase family 39 protein [Pseudomonadota bacterium]
MSGQPEPTVQFNGLSLTLIVGFYFAFHALSRLAFSGTLTTDDAEAIVTLDGLRLGYSVNQPPLYEWALFGAQKVFGVSLAANLAVKYAFLSAAVLFLYLAAKRVLGEPHWAAISVLSFSLFYQVGWNLIEGVTHTAGLIAAGALTLWSMLRVLQERDVTSYIILGLAIGLGLLAKFSYALVVFAFVLGALALPAQRRALRPALLFLSVAIGLAVASPYGVYLVTEGAFVETLQSKMGRTDQGLKSLLGVPTAGHVVSVSVLYALPLVPIFFLIFRRSIWADETMTIGHVDRDLYKYLAFTTAAGFLILLMGAVLGGFANVKERHLHPFFLCVPILLVGLIAEKPIRRRAMGLFMGVMIGCACVIALIRMMTFVAPYQEVCGRCREMIPYDGLADYLRTRSPRAKLVAEDHLVAGNLKRFFPERTILIGRRAGQEEFADGCLVVLTVRDKGRGQQRVRIIERVLPGLKLKSGAGQEPVKTAEEDLPENTDSVTAPWMNAITGGTIRTSTWRVTSETDPARCRTIAAKPLWGG